MPFGVQQALPEAVDGAPRVAALACPDCGGTLTVREMGGGLHFVCRIGHSYGLSEVLGAKEERLEDRLWTAVTAVDELAALLTDLQSRTRSDAARAEYRRRTEALLVLSNEVRRLIDTTEAVDLGIVEDAGTAPGATES